MQSIVNLLASPWTRILGLAAATVALAATIRGVVSLARPAFAGQRRLEASVFNCWIDLMVAALAVLASEVFRIAVLLKDFGSAPDNRFEAGVALLGGAAFFVVWTAAAAGLAAPNRPTIQLDRRDRVTYVTFAIVVPHLVAGGMLVAATMFTLSGTP